MRIVMCDFCKSRQGQTLQFEVARREMPYGIEVQYQYADVCLSCFSKKVAEYFRGEPQQARMRFLRLLVPETDSTQAA